VEWSGGEDVYKGAGCVVRMVYLTPGVCLSTANNKTVAPVLLKGVGNNHHHDTRRDASPTRAMF